MFKYFKIAVCSFLLFLVACEQNNETPGISGDKIYTERVTVSLLLENTGLSGKSSISVEDILITRVDIQAESVETGKVYTAQWNRGDSNNIAMQLGKGEFIFTLTDHGTYASGAEYVKTNTFTSIFSSGHSYVITLTVGLDFTFKVDDGIDLSNISAYNYFERPFSSWNYAGIYLTDPDGENFYQSAGKIHRDIKSENFLYDREKRFFKLIDFGISREADESGEKKSTVAKGTYDYMAPELFEGTTTGSYVTDIYALGILLYEMLAGRTPYSIEGDTSQAALVYAHLHKELPALKPNVKTANLADNQVIDNLDAEIRKACSKKPVDRYSNVKEMHKAFLEACNTSDSLVEDKLVKRIQEGKSREAVLMLAEEYGYKGDIDQLIKKHGKDDDYKSYIKEDDTSEIKHNAFFVKLFSAEKKVRSILIILTYLFIGLNILDFISSILYDNYQANCFLYLIVLPALFLARHEKISINKQTEGTSESRQSLSIFLTVYMLLSIFIFPAIFILILFSAVVVFCDRSNEKKWMNDIITASFISILVIIINTILEYDASYGMSYLISLAIISLIGVISSGFLRITSVDQSRDLFSILRVTFKNKIFKLLIITSVLIIFLVVLFNNNNSNKYEYLSKSDNYKNDMVLLYGGKFLMGSRKNECVDENGKSCWVDWNEEAYTDYDEEQHYVTVSSFWIGKYEITQKVYTEVMGYNPSSSNGSDLPVDNVSWYDTVKSCNRLSKIAGLKPYYDIRPNFLGNFDEKYTVTKTGSDGFRLPTEAEWEYACRAGTKTAYYWGSSIDKSYAWNDTEFLLHNVGLKKPNNWGIYDMQGNVSEWCWDWYNQKYDNSTDKNPEGPESGSYKVIRDRGLRSAKRSNLSADESALNSGFRVVRSAL